MTQKKSAQKGPEQAAICHGHRAPENCNSRPDMSSEGRTEAKNNKIHSLLFPILLGYRQGLKQWKQDTVFRSRPGAQQRAQGYTGPPASFRRALPSQARTGQGLASNIQGYSLIPNGGGDIIPGTRLAYRAHSPLLPKLHISRVKPGLATPTEDSSSFKHWALPMRTPLRFQIHHFITKLREGKVKANSDLNTRGPEPVLAGRQAADVSLLTALIVSS